MCEQLEEQLIHQLELDINTETKYQFKGWDKPKNIVIIEEMCNNVYHGEVDKTDKIHYGIILKPDNRAKADELMYTAGHKQIEKCVLTGERIERYIKPIEYFYENKDIKLIIAERKDGKLTCSEGHSIIEMTDGKRFKIKLDLENKMEIISQMQVNKGVVNGAMEITFGPNNVSLVHKSMDTYKMILKDTKHREQMEKNKTNKYKPGYMYSTLTENHVYLGEIYRCGEVELYKMDKDIGKENFYLITMYNKPKKMYLKVCHRDITGRYSHVDSFEQLMKNDVEKTMGFVEGNREGVEPELAYEEDLSTGTIMPTYRVYGKMYDMNQTMRIFEGYKGITKKLSMRSEGKKVLEIGNYTQILSEYLGKWRDAILNYGDRIIDGRDISCEDLLYNHECVNIFNSEETFEKLYKIANTDRTFLIKNENGDVLFRR